ncbi:hypothetical protein H310_13260 [Aphanomyces invadans]|uniref:Uncharacterized protein n=1 Tax=Aphanomyces invadans TaxID=157072 RepID=A0A024TDZ2_9STRA|nr:hypothetical protein H310_13260 [Aphanomyces invadans]ETV92360.1 hypothetical protein H310_13260 [Aphanomyces invadans]|eukprot:XP_008878911.1 hypothetical protein H310_13260 [Aphanomyces invadans]
MQHEVAARAKVARKKGMTQRDAVKEGNRLLFKRTSDAMADRAACYRNQVRVVSSGQGSDPVSRVHGSI